MQGAQGSPLGSVLVTGAGSGVGRAVAIHCGAVGYDVIAGVRDLEAAARLPWPYRVEVVALDVRDERQVASAVSRAEGAAGGLTAVVSNAAVLVEGTAEEVSVASFAQSFDVNALGLVRLVQACLPTMRARARGRIVIVGSTSGVVGTPFLDAYCASKFALEGIAESLHPVLAELGIAVTIVEPGPIASPLLDKARRAPTTEHAAYQSLRAAFNRAQQRAQRRAHAPAEVADAVVAVLQSPDPALRQPVDAAVERFLARKLADLVGSNHRADAARLLSGPPDQTGAVTH